MTNKWLARSIGLASSLLVATTTLAENYPVSDRTLALASSVLGTRLVATQPIFQADGIQVLEQGEEQFVRFTIEHGDIGGAPTDNDPEHSRLFNRPWSERVELRSRDTLRRNSLYEVQFRARMLEGFTNRAETIFQIHTGRKPPLMFFFRDFGNTAWTARILDGCEETCGWNDDPEMIAFRHRVARSQSMGNWHDYRIVLDTGSTPTISMWIDDTVLVANSPISLPSQHRPYIRLGVYRPGDLSINDTSVIDYSDLSITRLGRAPD